MVRSAKMSPALKNSTLSIIAAATEAVLVRTWSFILFLPGPDPTLIILLENSTPIVWDDKTRHSFLTRRCRTHDLGTTAMRMASAHMEIDLARGKKKKGFLVYGCDDYRNQERINILACPAGT